ncbi:hypothetical protein GIB67_011451, partial [Kingdonia uniflora]
ALLLFILINSASQKLIGARYFNKGVLAQDPNISFVYNLPRDETGHESPTMSIAARNYVRALADDVDIISMSMSFRGALPYEDLIFIASFTAMEKGVLVSFSVGNRGSNLMTVAGNPWSLTTGVNTIDRQLAGTLTLDNGKTIIGWSLFLGRTLLNASLVYNETLTGCNSPTLLSEYANNAIVVCSEGPRMSNQISTVIESTVTGVIFISTDEREEYLINYAKLTIVPKATIKFRQTFVGRGAKRAPQIPEYSFQRPSQNYRGVLKPDVVAPGSQVLAAWSPKVAIGRVGRNNLFLSSNYNILSGTLMACPHASGVAALLKGAHADWSRTTIRSTMMTTTNPLDNTNNLILDVEISRPVSGLDMEAGQIDPNKALNPGLIYDADVQNYVNYICSLNFTRKQFLTIARSSSYNCLNPSSHLNYPTFIASFSEISPTTQEFKRTVTNVGDGSFTYSVELTQPSGAIVSTGAMKLGRDAIVLTQTAKSRSIGFLSQSFNDGKSEETTTIKAAGNP